MYKLDPLSKVPFTELYFFVDYSRKWHIYFAISIVGTFVTFVHLFIISWAIAFFYLALLCGISELRDIFSFLWGKSRSISQNQRGNSSSKNILSLFLHSFHIMHTCSFMIKKGNSYLWTWWTAQMILDKQNYAISSLFYFPC